MTLLLLICGWLAGTPGPDAAELPSPLEAEQVARLARERREEIAAARASATAAAERPAIVGLEDPMVMASLDHLPFALHGYDASAMVEQRFPLSRELRNRRRAAEAQARRLHAETLRATLDVELEALSAFFMLYEQRRLREVFEEQSRLAEQIVAAARARYSAGTGALSDQLRAEAEAARLRAGLAAAAAEVAAAEAMLNASLARTVTAPVPVLASAAAAPLPPSRETVLRTARASRPELAGGRAEIEGAEAEIQVMRSMDAPMALVRVGVARTMAEGAGVMGLIGLSLPLYRDKRRAAVREAEAMAGMARADVAAMTRMIDGEVMAARENLIAARTRHEALRTEVLPRARQAVEAALASYGAGQGAMITVLEAASALWAVQAEEVMAESAAGVAQARFRRALGSPAGSQGDQVR